MAALGLEIRRWSKPLLRPSLDVRSGELDA